MENDEIKSVVDMKEFDSPEQELARDHLAVVIQM
jgi:hypothetical protein